MKIGEFVGKFQNHPVLFVGTGLSIRYLKSSYTWDGLLKKIAYDFTGNNEYYYDIKSQYQEKGSYRYDKIASEIEKDFNEKLRKDRNGKFKVINDLFYENMHKNINVSRFKLYIVSILKDLNYKETDEIAEFKKARKNISSVITTNYDTMMEDIFSFNPLIGNNILLSNPYGSLYKIHGCITQPDKIIITESDYNHFNTKYELIRAQLLSLFIHNPIIFLGYSIGDSNIKKILKTIFTYVDPNSKEAEKIRNNFLLVEYDKESKNKEVIEHDIDIEDIPTIRINKIKTDDFFSIYKALSKLELPVSAMDIRKVQTVVKEIYAGGNIKVSITEDLDDLENSDKILAIGSKKSVTYVYQNSSEIIKKYFEIMEEENVQILEVIDKIKIQQQQYFPIYGFSIINSNIKCVKKLKEQQLKKLKNIQAAAKEYLNKKYIELHGLSIESIKQNLLISKSYKNKIIAYASLERKIPFDELEKYIKEIGNKDNKTEYRMLICVYDYIKYGD